MHTTTDHIFAQLIAQSLGIGPRQTANTIRLLEEGATIPFISRYRKEATGGLDEVEIENIRDMQHKLSETQKRKQSILAALEEQGKLTDGLKRRIDDTWDNNILEDIYLPYRPKRKTRAETARQRGLEPLARILMTQKEPHPEAKAETFVNGEVENAGEALKGARDIIAEQVSADERARAAVRKAFARQAVISAKVAKGKEAEAANYRDYFAHTEPLKRCSSRRSVSPGWNVSSYTARKPASNRYP